MMEEIIPLLSHQDAVKFRLNKRLSEIVIKYFDCSQLGLLKLGFLINQDRIHTALCSCSANPDSRFVEKSFLLAKLDPVWMAEHLVFCQEWHISRDEQIETFWMSKAMGNIRCQWEMFCHINGFRPECFSNRSYLLLSPECKWNFPLVLETLQQLINQSKSKAANALNLKFGGKPRKPDVRPWTFTLESYSTLEIIVFGIHPHTVISSSECTVFETAVLSNRLDLVQYFLSCFECEIDLRVDGLPLLMAVVQGDYFKMMLLLLEHGTKVDLSADRRTVFDFATGLCKDYLECNFKAK